MLTIGFPCREYTTFERIIRISLTFNYKLKNKLILKYPVKGGLLQSYLCPSISAPNIWHFLKTTKNF